MDDILKKLSDYALVRVEEAKKKASFDEVKNKALDISRNETETRKFRFEAALKSKDLSFICEVKKASPSKGLIAPDFPYLEIAREYEAAGADCVSVLTEPKWFLGSAEYLKEIAESISLPCLRKDFIVDEYMIYEAKLLSASAVLFIAALLDEERLKRYLEIAESLGLSALVETHDEEEIRTAVLSGARLIGVNNRNLHDFSVDIENTMRLRSLIPPDRTVVAESGIKTAEDISMMREAGINVFLIGETLMRASDKAAKLRELRGEKL